jgi:serine/threonine-protein kinase RsbW
MERVLRSKVAAVSPFVDKLMLLIKNRRCAPGNETDIESALLEAPENAVVHGNHVDPRKHVYVRCRCKEEEVSIIVKDEGEGFDSNALPDPTAPGAIELNRGRGIYLMKGRKAISLEPFGYERNGGS